MLAMLKALWLNFIEKGFSKNMILLIIKDLKRGVFVFSLGLLTAGQRKSGETVSAVCP